MAPPIITDQRRLLELCERLSTKSRLAIDTEFVPEFTYLPQLCLIQIASDDEIAAVDPLAPINVEPFWSLLLDAQREVVVHAGKEEMKFCLEQTGRLPTRVFDVQLAAGFAGLGHPLSYSHIVHRVLGDHSATHETRTDWRKRPLSAKQIEYALDDVRHLLAVRDRLEATLLKMGRLDWFIEETSTQRTLLLHRAPGERFRRVAGSGGLSPRGLAVLRELAGWREHRARQLDKPTKWILRDDVLTELAKRQPRSLAELKSTRGLGSTDGRWLGDVLSAIERGLDLPDADCPQRLGRREGADESMILKLLSAAMLHLAQEVEISSSLLGSVDDLRDLLDWRARLVPSEGAPAEASEEAPRLARGWRAAIVGKRLTDILDGRIVVRIEMSDGEPRLLFEEFQGNPTPPSTDHHGRTTK